VRNHLIKSPIFENLHFVEHFFSTRVGGVSKGTFSSLNLGSNALDEDENDNVSQNWKILSDLLKADRKKIIQLNQVHGDKCLVLKNGTHNDDENAISDNISDAVITNKIGLLIGVKTADCCPILVSSGDSKAVGAVHAGWKGTILKNSEIAINLLVDEFGVQKEKIKAAIGPSIGACCYNITEDRAKQIIDKLKFAEKYMISKEDGLYFDLKGINSEILEHAGLKKANIDVSSECTFCKKDLFYSFRRDKEFSGRHFSGIMLRV